MSEPNTPQGTGATALARLTLEQGVAHIKAKLAEKGGTVEDQAIVHHDQDEEDDPLLGSNPGGSHDSAQEETAEGVSADASETSEAEPDALLDARLVNLPDGSQITVAEARKGYLRQADFTRKTQELARERERVAAREQAAVEELGSLYQHLASFEEAEPNWQDIARRYSPEEYQHLQNYWRNRAGLSNHAKQAVQQHHAKAFAAQRQQLWDTLAGGAFEPSWKDPNALRGGLEALSSYLVERGVPGELVSSIYLPAVIEIAEESRRYRELHKAKPRAALAVQGKPQPFKPGSKAASSPQSETIRSLHEAFRKNPNVDNAVALQRAKAAVTRR